MKKISAGFGWLLLLNLIFCSCEEDGITELPLMEITAEVQPVSAYNGADGAIMVDHTGGAPPYFYEWNTGDTTKNLSGLPAGSYELTIIYANSGMAQRTFEVPEPEPSALYLVFDVQEESYYGAADAQIALSISGGEPPYTILWDNGAEAATLTGLPAGTYTVTVTDASVPNPIVTQGTAIVAPLEFVCGRDSVTDVDGNKYPTVKLGDQCWTATNLRTQHRPSAPEEEIDGRFCLGQNCNGIEGAHYTWEAAMDGAAPSEDGAPVQGIAPEGWHIPSQAEWDQLNSWLAVDGNGGSGTNVPAKLRGADSPSGFDALYVGNWGYDVFTGDLAVFWSATPRATNDPQIDPTRAWYRLINQFPIFQQGHADMRNGMSIRCVKD